MFTHSYLYFLRKNSNTYISCEHLKHCERTETFLIIFAAQNEFYEFICFLALPFPSRRIFGNKSEHVSGERQKQLTTYMNCLMLTLAKIESCPIFGQPHKKSVQKLSGFFHESTEVTEEATELE